MSEAIRNQVIGESISHMENVNIIRDRINEVYGILENDEALSRMIVDMLNDPNINRL